MEENGHWQKSSSCLLDQNQLSLEGFKLVCDPCVCVTKCHCHHTNEPQVQLALY